MNRARSRLLTTLGYATLLIAAATTVGHASASGTMPDVMGFDDVSTSCTGGQNYYFQHNYQSLGALGWNDRISRFKATTASHNARWYENDLYGGYSFWFPSGGCDVDLTNNPLFPGSGSYWNDRISSLEVSN